MVALKEMLLGASCFMGFVSARYINSTSPSTSSSSIASSSVLSTSSSSTGTASATAFFSNVQLVDAYSGTNSSSDRSHWFMIEAEVYASAGYTDNLYLTIPEEFTDFPDGPFDLLEDSTVVGSVDYNSSNIFTIAFENSSHEDVSASFNFLTKLSSEAIDSISAPQTVDYTFDISTGSSYSSSIDYVAQDLSESQTNSGADNSSRAWFTLDIPLQEYPGSFIFAAGFSGSVDYEFDPSLTTIEIVTAVDAFNQPTKSINLTAVVDTSDESTINLSLDSQISGGKYIRITYFTQSISDDYIESVATLEYPTLSSYKREISIIFDEYVYLNSVANLAKWGEDISVMTDSDWFSTVTTSNTSSATSTSLSTSASTSISNVTTAYIESTSSSNGTQTSSLTTSSLPYNTSSVIPFATSLSNNTGSLTYTVITATSSGEYSVYTSFFPVSTLSSASAKQTSYANSSGVYTNTYLTESVITMTSNGDVTEITTLVPVTTIQSSISKTRATLNGTITSAYSLSAENPIESTAEPTITTEYYTSSYLSSLIFTTTRDGKVSEYTTWFPATTVATEIVTVAPPDFTVSTRAPKQSSNSSYTFSSGSSANPEMVSTVITKTENGKITEVTSIFPIATESGSASILSSSYGYKTSSSTAGTTEYETTSSGTSTSLSSLDSIDSYSTYPKSTKTSVSTEVVESTASEQISTIISIYGGSSLSTSAHSTSILVVSSYDGSGSHLEGGIFGLILGALVFLL